MREATGSEVRRPHAGLRRGGGSAGTGQQSSLKRSRFYQRDATLEAAAGSIRETLRSKRRQVLSERRSKRRQLGTWWRGWAAKLAAVVRQLVAGGVAAGRSAQRGTSGAATGGGGLQ